MLDERRYTRHRPVIYLKVFQQPDNLLIGHMVDISEHGIMLVTEEKVETGERLQLSFQPPVDAGAGEPVHFEAEVRWCRPEANPELFDLGLRVLAPSAEYRQAMQQLTAGYVFSDTA
ncbi:MAG: PilZ domain-containing protein [Wenzhouxiangella sp.]|nr:PilZ domain-containing protein [Wenzhouxiangella sp.]